jgi:hypothetical protein
VDALDLTPEEVTEALATARMLRVASLEEE